MLSFSLIIIDEAKKDIDDKYEDEKQKAEDKAEEEEIIEDRIEKSKEQRFSHYKDILL